MTHTDDSGVSAEVRQRVARTLARGRTLRVAGFDDGPFVRGTHRPVPFAGVICAATRFEGLLWGHIRHDGFDATRQIVAALSASKFLPQIHLVLTDGIAMGGFNVIDLPALAAAVDRPCVAVMRRHPDLERVEAALRRLSYPDRRWATLQRAGAIHERGGFVFQVCGLDPEVAADALAALTDTGHVPEALRLAHLITSAVLTGESSNRA